MKDLRGSGQLVCYLRICAQSPDHGYKSLLASRAVARDCDVIKALGDLHLWWNGLAKEYYCLDPFTGGFMHSRPDAQSVSTLTQLRLGIYELSPAKKARTAGDLRLVWEYCIIAN